MPNTWIDNELDFHGLTYEQPTDALAQFLTYCGVQVNLIQALPDIQAQIDDIHTRARVCQNCGVYCIPETMIHGATGQELHLCAGCARVPFLGLRTHVQQAFIEELHNVGVASNNVPADVGVLEIETGQVAAGSRRLGTIVARIRLITRSGERVIPAEIVDSAQSVDSDDVFLKVRIRGSDMIR